MGHWVATWYTRAMDEVPLPASLWAIVRAVAQVPLLEWFAGLHAENQARLARVRDLEAQLGHASANSSRPPSSTPPQASARPKALPSGRKRGGQPGHRGAFRPPLRVEQVDAIVAMVPERGNATARRCTGGWCRSRHGWDGCCGAGRRENPDRKAAGLDSLVAASEAALRGSPPPSRVATRSG